MKPLTYKDAGVDIDAGNDLVDRIKPLVKRTLRPEVLAGLGGFGGLFALPPTMCSYKVQSLCFSSIILPAAGSMSTLQPVSLQALPRAATRPEPH
jgi:hypothetical protein